MKPNCYDCIHRASLPFDAHSECKHPKIGEGDRTLTGFALMAGKVSEAMKRLNVSGNAMGIRKGWFYWPLNFDPTWLETCDGFESKEKKHENTSKTGSESNNEREVH